MTLRKQLFAEAWASGVPTREIARLFGVTMRQCFRLRRELDLPRRRRGRPRKATQQ
jgi:transposase